MKDNGGFEKLWKDDTFISQIISLVWDKAHCVSKWGDFRPEYKEVKHLRYLILCRIPFYLTSATLLPVVHCDVMEIL